MTVSGKIIPILAQKPLLYLLLHKPVQTVTTARDPQGRTTVFDILPAWAQNDRLVSVGRLDYFSEGLLILTNDGELTNRLTHPRHHAPKTYEVLVRGPVGPKTLATMERGMTLSEGETLAPVAARVLSRGGDRTTLELILTQGLNRQIRRMCRDLGLTILRLRRTRLGPISLGDLPPGQCRALTPSEVKVLLEEVE